MVFKFTNQDNTIFFSARTSPNVSHFPCQTKHVLERDPKNISYYQPDIENYMHQVLNFSLFDKHEYTPRYTLWFWSVYLCFKCMYLFLCSSRFDWQNQFLFSENRFSEEMLLIGSNTLCHTFFLTKIISLHWNGTSYTCKEKIWQKTASEYLMS